jgi:RNA polymerase sigma-70 factor (ECF subfamily)
VRRAAKGDLDAFENLFRRHQKRVYNISLQMLSDESDAADATQEVFVRAFRSIAKLKSEAAFVSWLKTLTVNYCRDVLRRRMRTGIVESLDKPLDVGNGSPMRRDPEDWSGNPERAFARKDVSETVQKAISSLVPQYREVVALFYVDGAEVAEIAKILKCPVGTVKSRLARARGELKRKLAHLVES